MGRYKGKRVAPRSTRMTQLRRILRRRLGTFIRAFLIGALFAHSCSHVPVVQAPTTDVDIIPPTVSAPIDSEPLVMYPEKIDLSVESGELYTLEHLDAWESQLRTYLESGLYVYDDAYLSYAESVLRMIESCRELINYKCLPNETLVQALAKMVTQEIGGLDDTNAYSTARMEEAAVTWCVLNRTDARYKEPTAECVVAVLKAPKQFAYRSTKEIHAGIEDLCTDVLIRWQLEHHKLVEDCGRVLPKEYQYFHGDGRHNHFRIEFEKYVYWDWSLPDPYVK